MPHTGPCHVHPTTVVARVVPVVAMAAEGRETKLDATKSSQKVKVKVGQNEHVRVKKDKDKSLVKFEELLLQLESFPVCPKTNKDVGTQVQKGLLRRILGEPNIETLLATIQI